MLDFGAAAYTAQGELLGTFAANLATLPDAAGHPDAMAWWATQPDAWAACRQDLQDPAVALPAFAAWLDALPGKPVFVAYPAAYDFSCSCTGT